MVSHRWVGAGVALATLLHTGTALACGCLNPPVPEVGESDYAVNQLAEQIIFEVEDAHITAHVLIKYAGDPESFAWIVPVPSLPELGLSEDIAFGILDNATQPSIFTRTERMCPDTEYRCEYHRPPVCPSDPGEAQPGSAADAGAAFGAGGGAGGGDGDSAPADGAGGVQVIAREQIGDYDTVIFTAEEAATAVAWLQDEGFIVNDTTTPYMQPYLDADMLFVASKLVPGAGVDSIKPLRMRYEGDMPMIPLQLTAVAAEPHLTVTSYIFGDAYYEPVDHPLMAVGPEDISVDDRGRSNYPMVLARLSDAAGGDGFVREFAGSAQVPLPNDDSGCCGAEDFCGLQQDGQCQCPADAWDAVDCAEEEALQSAFGLVRGLGERHRFLTRLTTRVSPEEMTFDPMFRPAEAAEERLGRLAVQGRRLTLRGCEVDVIDRTEHARIELAQRCATTWCGQGTCAVDDQGRAGCLCEAGYIARSFTDLDGQPSVTCVPRAAPVDFGADGLDLPSACDGVDVRNGRCVDLGGFPAVDCGDAVATLDGDAITCAALELDTATGGARDYTAGIADIRVCAPPPPASCGEFGWLVDNDFKRRDGVLCESSVPQDRSRFVPPPAPTCGDAQSGRYPGGGGVPSPAGGDGDGAFDGSDRVPLPEDEPRPAGGPPASEVPQAESDDGGCGCGVTGGDPFRGVAWLGVIALAGVLRRRRR
jgi:MYXO-CTERM domain-containing protein